MPREKFRTLTPQMFYILICLKEECIGTDIMQKVEQMTGGKVQIGAGTLYNLLSDFSAEEMIRETKVEGRKRSYILTESGLSALNDEYERLKIQIEHFESYFKE